MNYYILVNGQQTGPFTIEQLGVTGIEPDTMVWTEGMTEWQPAWQVPALATIMKPGNAATPQPPQPAAPPQPQYDNTVAPVNNAAAPVGNDPYAPIQPKKKKKTWLWILIILFLLLAIAAGVLKFTNPSKEAHMEKLKTVMTEAMNKMDTSGMDDATKAGMQMGMGLVTKMLDSQFEYHDKFFYSYVTGKGSDKKLTTGFLGKVTISDEEEIAKAFNELNKMSNGNNRTSDEVDDYATDEDTDSEPVDEISSDDTKELEEALGELLGSEGVGI